MEHERQVRPFDVAVAVSAGVLGAVLGTTRRAGSVLAPAAGAVRRPVLLHRRLPGGRWWEDRSREGQDLRAGLLADVSRRLDALVPLVFGEVLRRADLTGVVLQYVDLDAIVQAVLEKIDLVELAGEVIDGVDLPEIIRESTGSMASAGVQGARMQAIVADEAVARAVDRFLQRRGSRSTQVPAPSETPQSSPRATIASPRDPHR